MKVHGRTHAAPAAASSAMHQHHWTIFRGQMWRTQAALHTTACRAERPPLAWLTKLGKHSAKVCLGCLLSLCSRSFISVTAGMKWG